MARQLLYLALPLLLCSSWSFLSATAQQDTPQAAAATETYDVYKEIDKLKGWKAYLQVEVDKWKAEAEKAQAALTVEQKRTEELAGQVDQLKKAVDDADARAAVSESRAAAAEERAKAAETRANLAEHNVAVADTKTLAAEARAAAAEHGATGAGDSAQLKSQLEQLKKDTEAAQARAAEAEAKAASQAASAAQLSAQLEQLKKDAEDAKAKAAAHAAASAASNGEATMLRRQLAAAVADRESLESRITELSVATAKSGGLRGHALAIYDILVEEAARHHEAALNYANEKLPGLKAKVADVHATVSSQLPDVSGHVGQFVGRVDGELRPWLRQTLGSVPALKRYSEDPVVLQGTVYAILGAPLLVLVVVPLLTCCCRMGRRPKTSTGRGSEGKSARRGKKKQG